MNTDNIRKLASLRRSIDVMLQGKLELQKSFEDTIQYRAFSMICAKIAEDKVALEALEKNVRDEALACFGLDGNKKPIPGIEIKVFPVVSFKATQESLRDWCFNNFRPALKLDMAKVLEAAKTGDLPYSYAEIISEPRVQIASNLDEYVSVSDLP